MAAAAAAAIQAMAMVGDGARVGWLCCASLCGDPSAACRQIDDVIGGVERRRPDTTRGVRGDKRHV